MTEQPPSDPWRGQHRVPPAPDGTAELPPFAMPPRRSWWARLDPAPRALVILLAAAAVPLVLCVGGLATSAVFSGDGGGGDQAGPAPSTTVPASPTPAVELRTITETEEIPFEEVVEEDPSLAEGTREIRTDGVPGERTIRYEVTITDGVQTGKRKLGEEVTREPVDQVVVVGTKPPQPEPEPEPEPQPQPEPEPEPAGDCHPSYTGACVPFASDVDCEGGSGDGPAYVRGPVRVVGEDVYDLDRDGDGVACEP